MTTLDDAITALNAAVTTLNTTANTGYAQAVASAITQANTATTQAGIATTKAGEASSSASAAAASAASINPNNIDINGGTVDGAVIGGAVPAAGSFTSLSATGALTTAGLKEDTSGNLGLGVVPSARNNTVLQIKDGIGFPSTQVTSTDPNTLDDYEEGTWTPAYATTGGSFTHVNTSGAYTKIGRKVTVQGVIETSSATVGTGEVRISGLPFTPSASLAFASRSSVGIGRATGFSGDVPCGLYVVDNSPNLWLQYRTTANGATLDLNASDLNTGAGNGLFFTATYFV